MVCLKAGGGFECFFVEVVVTSTLLPCEGGFDKVNDFVIRLEILARSGLRVAHDDFPR